MVSGIVFYWCFMLSVDAREYCWADATLRWYGNDMAIDDDPLRFISIVSSFMGWCYEKRDNVGETTARKCSHFLFCLRERNP